MTGNSCYLLPAKRFDTFQRFLTLAGAGALLLGCWSLQAQALYEIVPGQILIQPKADLPEAALRALLAAHNAEESDVVPGINLRVLDVPEEHQNKILEALQHNPNIEFAEPDYLLAPNATPNDTYFGLEWHLNRIGAPGAWNYTVGSSSVTIAILDSGIDANHPDLAGLLVPGWNFYNNNSDISDLTGHGTAVAGVAAALSNNGSGVAGVAWNCRLMPLRIVDPTGYGDTASIAKALTWAADHGARVANISYGNVSKISSIISAAQYFQSKGGVVTASAGNETAFDSTSDNPYFLVVSATDENDLLCSWSNTGNNVDLSAPGNQIVTTVEGGSYAYGVGTSFAAPVVAGVAALVISANPSLSGSQVQNILKNNADDLGTSGWDTKYGWGRVNAARAVAATGAPAPDTITPTASILGPIAGAILSGAVSVNLSGADSVGVTRLELYIDGSLKASYSTSSAIYAWDTIAAANSAHTLLAKAYDAAGNVGTSTAVAVTVNNLLSVPDIIAPTAQITSPTSGTRISRTVAVNVAAHDNVGVTRIDLYIDGIYSQTSASYPTAFTWNTRKTANGNHTLQAFGYDAAGNRGTSAVVTVTK